MLRFRFAVLLLTNSYLVTSSTIIPRVTCPYIPETEGWQEECQDMLSDYQERCDEYLKDEGATFLKDPGFRAQVVCHHVETESFKEMASGLRTEFDERVFSDSKKVKELLREDMRERLSQLAKEEVQDEIDLIRVNSLEKVNRFKSLLARMEQSYLRTITSILQRSTGKTAASEPPTTPKSKPTTYQPIPSTEPQYSNMGNWISNAFYTTSPKLYRNFKFKDGEWEFSENSSLNHTATAPLFRWSENRIEIAYRIPYTMYRLKPQYHLPKLKTQTEEGEDTKYVLMVMFYNCWNTDTVSKGWAHLSYLNVVFQLDSKDWLTLTYESTEHQAGSIPDPLQDDLTGSIVVVIDAMGSKAKVSDCKNEVPGAGVYRMFENGTCFGMSIFSKQAAQIDKYCSDKMVPGAQISQLTAKLYIPNDNSQLEEIDTHVFYSIRQDDPFVGWVDGSDEDNFKPARNHNVRMEKYNMPFQEMDKKPLERQKMPIYLPMHEMSEESPKKYLRKRFD